MIKIYTCWLSGYERLSARVFTFILLNRKRLSNGCTLKTSVYTVNTSTKKTLILCNRSKSVVG